MSYDTLQQETWVAQRVPIRLRVNGLSWSHHLAVAPLEPDGQRAWLETAKREGMKKPPVSQGLGRCGEG